MASNCSALDTYTSFIKYVRVMRNLTNDNLTIPAMEPCRSNICSTLYGVGNADISGIGVSHRTSGCERANRGKVVVGYITHLCLGTFLASAVLIMARTKSRRPLTRAIQRGYDTYGDAAVVLAFSIQVAAVVLLVKKSFGISAVNFGDLTIEVTWAAALLTILPILLICLITSENCQKGNEKTKDSRELRLFWISIVWLLFFFTFASRMVSYYSSGQIGSGPGSVISKEEAGNIKELCFRRLSIISAPEHLAFEFFALGGSLFTSIIVIAILVDGIAQRREAAWSSRFRESTIFLRLNTSTARSILIFNTLLWGIPQIWTIFRYRELQSTLAQFIEKANYDNEWSFGQIMAVVVFLPVPAQFVYELLQQSESIDSSSLDQMRSKPDSDKVR